MLPHADLFPADTAVRVAVRDDDRETTYAELAADAFGLRGVVPLGGVAALRGRRARTLAAAFAALDGWAERVDLVGALDPEQDAVAVDDVVTLTTRASGSAVDGPEITTRWRLFTSGTTGAPKPVDHTLASLSRTVRRGGEPAARRWGLLYEPTRMAGVQVVLQALANGDTLVDATAGDRLPDRLRRLADAGVDSLSATPTLWRQVLQSADPTAVPLRQITLGGEVADQRVLHALRATYPAARITHVFASTETGAAFSVSDGRAGFPRSFLTASPGGIRLDVRDGELFVHAPQSSAAGPDGFAGTGDLVEVTEDRVLFLGRSSGIVNVGGTKVVPEQVEVALREDPDVLDAVVGTRSNPFSGQILVASVVPRPGADRTGLAARLRASVAHRLGSAHAPASVKLVDRLATSATGKAGR